MEQNFLQRLQGILLFIIHKLFDDRQRIRKVWNAAQHNLIEVVFCARVVKIPAGFNTSLRQKRFIGFGFVVNSSLAGLFDHGAGQIQYALNL